MRKILWVMIPIFLVAVVLVALALYAKQPGVEYLQGQMEAKRVLVASKVPGRIAALYAKEGDSVTEGMLLAQIASPEIEAKKMQADGALQAATAQFQKAKAGTRKEQIEQAEAQAQRAGEALEFANATYSRVKKLFDEGVLPQQKHDEALLQMQNASALKAAADAQLRMAQAGAQEEDKEAAHGLVVQAGGAKNEALAYLDETRLSAPISGEVTLKTVEAGELVGTGMPVFAITDLKDA
jgi:HlyD family secretion protein